MLLGWYLMPYYVSVLVFDSLINFAIYVVVRGWPTTQKKSFFPPRPEEQGQQKRGENPTTSSLLTNTYFSQ